MIELIVAYILLVILVTAPLVFMLKTRLWSDYFLFFLSLSAFALLNVYGLYALAHSVIITPLEFINFSRVFTAFLLVIVSFYIMFPLYLAFGPSRLAIRWTKVVPDSRDKHFGTATICLLWCLCAAVIVYYFAASGTLPPLMDLAEGRLVGLEYKQIEALRWESRIQGFHWFALAFYDIPAFLVLYSYALKHFIPSRSHNLIFWISLGTAAVLSVMFLNKINIVFLFIGLSLCVILQQSRIRIRYLLGLGFGLAVAFWLYAVFYSATTIPLIGLGKIMWHRIIESYSMAAGIVLSLFPDHLAFFNGVTINNPGGLLPYEHVDLSFIVYSYLYRVEWGGAPSAGVWEGYANFGYLGLAMFCMLMQFLVFALHLSFRLAKKDAFMFAFFVFVSLKIVKIWTSSLFYTIIHPPFILTLVILLGVRYGLIAPLTSVGRKSNGRRDIISGNK